MTKQVTEQAREEKKKQKISVTYTLKSFSENIKKFKELELINKDDAIVLEQIHKNIMEKWTEQHFGIKMNLK